MRSPIVLAVAFAVVFTQEAHALRSKDTEVTFFAERTLRTVVGSWELPCGSGGIIKTGRRSPFFVRTSSPCGNHGPLTGSTLSCHFTEAGCSSQLAGFQVRSARRKPSASLRHRVKASKHQKHRMR